MKLTIEKVERLMESADVGYETAKEALEASNGDLLEAAVALERDGRLGPNAKHGKAATFTTGGDSQTANPGQTDAGQGSAQAYAQPDGQAGAGQYAQPGYQADTGQYAQPGYQAGQGPYSQPGYQAGQGPYAHPGYQAGAGQYAQPGYQAGTGQYAHPGYQAGAGQYSQPGYQAGAGQYSQPGYQAGTGQYSQPGYQAGQGQYAKPHYHQYKDESASFEEGVKRFFHWIGRAILAGVHNSFDVRRHGERVFGFPVILFLFCLIPWVFWIVVILLIVGLFCGFRYGFSGPHLGKKSVNDAMGKASDIADDIKGAAEKKPENNG